VTDDETRRIDGSVHDSRDIGCFIKEFFDAFADDLICGFR